MNPLKLLDPSYLFNPQPGEFHHIVLFLGFFLILTIGSFYVDAWIKKHPHRTSIKHILPKVGQNLRIFGLVGFVFLWVRYESLILFSMRFLFLVYLAVIAWYIGNAIHKYKTRLPIVIEQHANSKKKKQYLPKRKSKKKKKK